MISAIKYLGYFVAGAVALASCSLVDEDLSDCETNYKLDYELRLVTNLTTELQTQLTMVTDVSVATALRRYLSGVFTDYAHDVDLGFYDVTGDSLRLHHETHIMDANQSSYTLRIPVRRYMHTAVANMSANDLLVLQGDEYCHSETIVQERLDTIPTQKAGIFTARTPMEVLENKNQQFNVRLYIANCASAISIDTIGSNIQDIKVFMTGFASDFRVCDSTFRFAGKPPVVVADRVSLDEAGHICYASVNFPSRDVIYTRTIIDTEDPFISEDAQDALWEVHVYALLKDGTITQSTLGSLKPLRAGQVKVIKSRVTDNGTIVPADASVTVSVVLDWTPGLHGHVVF